MALLMGATMTVIMLAYMLGMYSNMQLNIAIFVGAIIVFALSLWLVRSQVTVSRAELNAGDDPAPLDRHHDVRAGADP